MKQSLKLIPQADVAGMAIRSKAEAIYIHNYVSGTTACRSDRIRCLPFFDAYVISVITGPILPIRQNEIGHLARRS